MSQLALHTIIKYSAVLSLLYFLSFSFHATLSTFQLLLERTLTLPVLDISNALEYILLREKASKRSASPPGAEGVPEKTSFSNIKLSLVKKSNEPAHYRAAVCSLT